MFKTPSKQTLNQNKQNMYNDNDSQLIPNIFGLLLSLILYLIYLTFSLVAAAVVGCCICKRVNKFINKSKVISV